MDEHWVFICIDQKGKESKSLERQRKSNMTSRVSTKFRKIVQENTVKVITSRAALVDNISRGEREMEILQDKTL
jgi:hypothetical protein